MASPFKILLTLYHRINICLNIHDRLDIVKALLANLTCTVPESLSRAMGNMKRRKLVQAEGTGIRLLNRSSLEELAEKGKNSR